MAPPKSKCWRYFTKVSKDKAQCNVCLKILKTSGNTSNLLCHIKQKHQKMVACITEEYKNLQTHSDLGQLMKDAVMKEIEKRFSTIEKSFLLVISTILDPRFKNIHFNDPLAVSSVLKYIRNEIKNDSEDSEGPTTSDSPADSTKETNFDIWAHHKKLAHTRTRKQKNLSNSSNDEISQYLNLPVRNLTEHPLIIWEEMKIIYPTLYKIANKFLLASATSISSERLFSKAGATATATRNRLAPKRLSRLLFLNSLSDDYV
ncbi:uncharacterized protein LOC135266995 [Tribolium castaneum]|uniref:uncharacterized protein LOC135266995 n=1 Tax=Tribolium castaneum TaxID=7070 RepID=UPI00046BEDF8